ncbi:hypothetical protein C8Q80DRAFT_1274411 [Daedaleopsis nitida]|nr:hypothetical protein C8Q80DRAFT_1274411 [Daedaleopsis nitida]
MFADGLLLIRALQDLRVVELVRAYNRDLERSLAVAVAVTVAQMQCDLPRGASLRTLHLRFEFGIPSAPYPPHAFCSSVEQPSGSVHAPSIYLYPGSCPAIAIAMVSQETLGPLVVSDNLSPSYLLPAVRLVDSVTSDTSVLSVLPERRA